MIPSKGSLLFVKNTAYSVVYVVVPISLYSFQPYFQGEMRRYVNDTRCTGVRLFLVFR